MSRRNNNSNWRTLSPEMIDWWRRRKAENEKLHFSTVSPLLVAVLKKLMKLPDLNRFWLWGSTCLSLRKGHREGATIELVAAPPSSYTVFSPYRRPIDFADIDRVIDHSFDYLCRLPVKEGVCSSYQLGISEAECVEVNLSCSDSSHSKIDTWRGIRLASCQQLAVQIAHNMAQDRSKANFWDFYELAFSPRRDGNEAWKTLADILGDRYPGAFPKDIIAGYLTDFSIADTQPDPVYYYEDWETIKTVIKKWVAH